MKNKSILSFQHRHNNKEIDICIAPIHQDDAKRLIEIGNDKEIAKNVGDTFPHPYTIEDAHYWITTGSKLEDNTNYGIYINNVYAGNLGRQKKYTGRSIHNIHFGYRLGREYWGKGIMTHIVQQVIPYIFNSLPDAHRIYARVFGRNHGSRRVLEKTGMNLESHRKEFVYYEGSRHDEYEYAILRQK